MWVRLNRWSFSRRLLDLALQPLQSQQLLLVLLAAGPLLHALLSWRACQLQLLAEPASGSCGQLLAGSVLVHAFSAGAWISVWWINNVPRSNSATLKSLEGQLDRLTADISLQRQNNSKLIESLKQLTHIGEEHVAPPGELADPDFAVESDIDVAVIGVLVFACDRTSVGRHIDQLLRYRPDPHRFPIVVSQDCGDLATSQTIDSYGDQLTHVHHKDASDVIVPVAERHLAGYYRISRHYRWALEMMFEQRNYQQVIVMEDDLDVSPDVFEYFAATLSLLRADQSTLWCISAWNDNGKKGLIDASRPDLLYRSDFFPGLGWMLTKQLWIELRDKWPQAYWDDWMRKPEQRLGRQCIRPEISRTRTFGKIGISKGLFFERHLKFIELNQTPVQFSRLNLSYLQNSEYARQFSTRLHSCGQTDASSLQRLISSSLNSASSGCVRLTYTTRLQFKRLAKLLALMDDFKSGVPRGSYHGVVSVMYRGLRVYLVPGNDWSGYDPSWS